MLKRDEGNHLTRDNNKRIFSPLNILKLIFDPSVAALHYLHDDRNVNILWWWWFAHVNQIKHMSLCSPHKYKYWYYNCNLHSYKSYLLAVKHSNINVSKGRVKQMTTVLYLTLDIWFASWKSYFWVLHELSIYHL